MTSAQSAVLIAALVFGGAAFALLKANSHAAVAAAPLATNLAMAQLEPDMNRTPTGPVVPPRPAVAAAPSAAALDKVKAALHDPNPTIAYPNPVMQEAIAGLGGQKKAALPILETALSDADAPVRLRAVDGLGIIGPEAGEAAPLLLGLLRDGGFRQAIPQTGYILKYEMGVVVTNGIYTDNMLLYALGQIHPLPEILPQFARSMTENRSVAQAVLSGNGQFESNRRRIVGGGWLWDMANEDAKALNDAFRPLLQAQDPAVQLAAARSLVAALGDQADAAVFPVAAELLQYHDLITQQDGLFILQGAARNPDAGVAPGQSGLYAPRLGPYLNDTVSALAFAAYNGVTEEIRVTAAKMLDVLVPDLGKSNPALAAQLDQQRQQQKFVSQAIAAELATPEIQEGLKKFPDAAPQIAPFFARNGFTDAVELLPAFADALAALAP